MNSFQIDNKTIREYGNVFIIAEAGVNHNGELKKALQLVNIAADSGADAVKFQTFKAEQVVTEKGEMATYQKKNIGKVTGQREMLRSLELPEEYYLRIIAQCKKRGIMFLSTPHGGKASVDLLEHFGVKAYKIGSGDLNNYILLKRVALTKKPIILSSGMSNLKEIQDAIAFIKSNGNSRIAVLHCTSNYPCPPAEVNLLAMKTMMEKLNVPVGYSDHTNVLQTAIMAAALGAAVYEAHFTIDKSLPGPDHVGSSDPRELRDKVEAIRIAYIILGSLKKVPTKNEIISMRIPVRRSIVAARELKKGTVIKEEYLEAKRPGDGVPPSKYRMFIGRIIKRDIKADEQLTFRDIN